MNTNPIVKRLRWHAGLEKEAAGTAATVAECTWLPNLKVGSLEAAVADVIGALSELNFELNGPKPTENQTHAQSVDMDLVYAIEESRRIIRQAFVKASSESDRILFYRQEEKIATAWRAVLAGDIDDILAHIAEQEWAQQ